MKEVSINPTGFDWGNLGWVPRNFSVERWGVAEESKEQVRILKASSDMDQEGNIYPQKMQS